ncbi:MAG: 50S ribosomal protein L4 [Ignavibacteria bacterium]|jgi:large subunit ribosomal protein L4|nr:50S ribosomal protein L4 [Ignavibacteria bacterium]MCU7514927.1 50S ribosomal protein L4 [Ignavibacteria bacterium]MCU7521505.1 50S ribosomal protein L4 [Ignavibacteria bacterium]
MTLDVYKIDGTKSGEQIDLNDGIFNIEPNQHAIYLAVKAQMTNKRQGTHKSKERSEVAGGGKKPWRQKGRGGARAGTTRSPLWVGGGTVFGPKPIEYKESVNKKVSKLARKSALALKAKGEQIIVVEDFGFDAPKTKEFNAILSAFKLNGKRTLVLYDKNNKNVFISGRNIQKLNIMEANTASTYDLLNNQMIILQKSAVKLIEQTFDKNL